MNTELVNNLVKSFKESVDGVKNATTLSFSENLVVASGCNNYGCTCISYEKCCGCLLQ